MSRSLTTSVNNAVDDDIVEPFFAVDLMLEGMSFYLWTGNYDVTINSKPYIGAGSIMSISRIDETGDLDAKGATITITGIPSEYISAALTLPYLNRECRIYFGVMSDPTDYTQIFTGEIDQMNIVEQPGTATIQINVENVLVILERPTIRRYTHEDQQTRYPGDLGLIFVAGLQDKDIPWGRETA
jgi:hypothetical protein